MNIKCDKCPICGATINSEITLEPFFCSSCGTKLHYSEEEKGLIAAQVHLKNLAHEEEMKKIQNQHEEQMEDKKNASAEWMFKNQKQLIIIVSAIACLLLITIVITSCISSAIARKHAPSTTIVNQSGNAAEQVLDVKEQVVIKNQMVADGIRNIGNLQTAEYYFTQVGDYSSEKDFHGIKLPFTTSKCIYSYDGEITAGIDFTKIDIDIDDNKKKIYVTVPKAKILSSEIFNDSFKVYDEKESIFNNTNWEDFNTAQEELKKNAETNAVERGLLKNAQKNAEAVLENFISSTYGMTDYKVVFDVKDE